MEQYIVTGMSCAACQARVEKAVSAVPGVDAVLNFRAEGKSGMTRGFVCVNGKNSRVVYPTAEMAEAAGHIYKHGKGDDAGTCLDPNKVMNVHKV